MAKPTPNTPVKKVTEIAKTAKNSEMLITLLPPLLMVGGVVTVVLVGRKMFSGITDTASEAKEFLTKQEQNISDAVIEKEILKATLSIQDAKRMAQGLYDSMADWGTDEERIKTIFERIQNKADYLMIHREFGLRPYGGLYGDNWLARKTSSDRHLAYWLKSEISEDDECYKLVKKWVTAAGFGF